LGAGLGLGTTDQRVPSQESMSVLVLAPRGAAYLAIFLIALGQFAMLLFVTYYFQRTLGFSAIRSGLAFLPWLAAFTTMAQVGTRVIAKRVGPRWTIAPGIAIVGIALVMRRRVGRHRRCHRSQRRRGGLPMHCAK
jgi:hypothetical protein